MKNARTSKKILGLLGGAALGLLGQTHEAQACGCFTPPDPSVPVVQAGERIAFAQSNGQVTAHIQIQYQGDAKDFGWLLPLPAVPSLTLGVDELFNQLTATTQPKYKLNRVYEGNCAFNPGRGGGFANSGAGGAAPTAGGEGDTTGSMSPLVIQSSIGPYDYAVLKADSKDAMLKWLSDNHYFVPAGTDDTVGPYIRPGAFFLALKLQSGKSSGDLQPVVVNYASDLPMIPIVLTSTGAKDDMGIQVWMLGAGRAIPRNYYHTVIDDAMIDWVSAGQNYNDVIIKATHEADGRHTFVTEYAGSSSVMRNILNAQGRYGVQADLAAQPDAQTFVDYLFAHQFGQTNNNQGGGGGPVSFGAQLTSQELAILGNYIPVPAALLAKGYTAQSFYQSIDYFLGSYRQQFPNDFAGYVMNYQPVMIAQDLWDRVVTPTLQAGALFDQFPYLTRLYTTLSAQDMNKDPVFSWNPGLPDWANEHDGTLTYHCGYFGRDSQATTPATLVTAAGWVIQYPYGTGTTYVAPPGLPASQRIEILAEEGDPQVIIDNTSTIAHGLPMGSGGCGVSMGSRASETAGGLVLLLFAGSMLIVSRRRKA